MSLRVLHIDSGREWRGGQRQVYLLARGQRDRGHEPLVVAHPDSPLARRLRGAGLAASAVRMRGEWDLAAARRVRALIRTWRADVVHAHDARAHSIALTALLGRRSAPLVVTRRVAFQPRGRMKYGDRVARFIAISRAVGDALAAAGVDRSRIDIVYSGVPAPKVVVARDWRSELRWPADCVICGVVGAMTAEKGIVQLQSIGQHLPDQARARARLVLLGGQSMGAVEIGGVPAFRAGFIDEVHDAMAGLDMLWHPSSAEGLGTAVIDAMALRVPPVAFAVGGLTELIVDGESGVLVPAGNSQSFARAAAVLISDEGERRRLGECGKSRAALFSVERMIAGTEETYRRVLAG